MRVRAAATGVGRASSCSTVLPSLVLGVEGLARYAIMAFPMSFAAADVLATRRRWPARRRTSAPPAWRMVVLALMINVPVVAAVTRVGMTRSGTHRVLRLAMTTASTSSAAPRPAVDLVGARCVVTGGLGFIGSNVVHRLVGGRRVGRRRRRARAGARRRPRQPGRPGPGDVEVLVADIGDARRRRRRRATPTSCSTSPGRSATWRRCSEPLRDLDLNVRSHLAFLETVRRVAPAATVVQTSTRQVYGRPQYLPVDEEHPTAAGRRQRHRQAGVRAVPPPLRRGATTCAVVVLRLTNVYGPRQHLEREGLGFLPVFVRQALLGEDIVLFGDGTQRRDCVHVDDVVEALLLAGDHAGGGGRDLQPRAPGLADAAPRSPRSRSRPPAGAAAVRCVPWPDELLTHRHRQLPGRLRQGQAGPRVVAAHLLRRRHRATRSATTSTARGPRRRPDAAPPSLRASAFARRHRARPRVRHRAARRRAGGARARARAGAARRPRRPATHVVGVASGAAALQLALAALGVGPGDEVIVPGLHRRADRVGRVRASAPRRCPSTSIRRRRRSTRTPSPRPLHRARPGPIVVVHLYGRPATVEPFVALGVPVIEDAAQAHGALAGVTGAAAIYSFYPTKNVGGIGDGGAVVTADAELAATVRRLRVHGMTEQYVHVDISQNHPHERARGGVAARCSCPHLARRQPSPGRRSPAATARPAPSLRWHADHPDHVVPPVRAARVDDRDAVRAALADRGVATGVHYPLAIDRAAGVPAPHHGALPAGRGVGGRVRLAPLLPGAHRRRGRPRRRRRWRTSARDPPQPGGRRRSRRSSPATTTSWPSPRWSATSTRVLVDSVERLRDHRRRRRLDRRLASPCSSASPTRSPSCASCVHEAEPRLRRGAACRASPRRPRSGSSTPTATPSTTPRS